jgi:hypothetical protein
MNMSYPLVALPLDFNSQPRPAQFSLNIYSLWPLTGGIQMHSAIYAKLKPTFVKTASKKTKLRTNVLTLMSTRSFSWKRNNVKT